MNFARRNFPFAFLLGRLHRFRLLRFFRFLWLFGLRNNRFRFWFLRLFGLRKNRLRFGFLGFFGFWKNRFGLGFLGLFRFLWFFGLRNNRFGLRLLWFFGLLRLWFRLNRFWLGLRIGSRALLSHGVVYDSRFPVPHKFKTKMSHSRLLLRVRSNRDAEISTFISIRQIGGEPRCVTAHEVSSCGGHLHFYGLSARVGIPCRR